ncbi:MAG: helix-turn-helix domain-containing protein [Muribaculaceae bacterium]|nr:helix-turn-helix domain-containing protein [Roseburia sp.]MCM1432019.1 helix-turn-helix domain-containing protein [Muribaculaceae bacterium]MCM1493727.1 helix-turn-helix domain-containing protein [Muribaculaceae bacterium]
MKFGDVLGELLEKHEITQKDFAQILGVTPSALGNYIHNTREPDYQTLRQIADYFNLSTDYLLSHTTKSGLTHNEELLLHIFRSLNPEQKEFYIMQGQIFIRQNNKKESSLSPQRNDSVS